VRLPVTVVAGLAGRGKTGLIEAWRAKAPQSTALVIDRGDDFKFPRASDGAGEGEAGDPGLERVGGCACCTAGAALGAALRRLLRRGSWAHLLIDLNGGAHPSALIDALRAPPLAAALRLVELVSVIDAERLSERLAGTQRRWLCEQVQSAHRVLVWVPAAMSAAVVEERVGQVLSLVGETGFAPEIEVWREGTPAPAPGVGERWAAGVAVSGGLVLSPSLDQSEDSAPSALLAAMPGVVPRWCWRWRAPPDSVFDRARLIEAMSAIAHSSLHITAVLRTEREWYRYHAGGWEPDWWRRDSRVLISFAPGELPGASVQLAAFADRLRASQRGT